MADLPGVTRAQTKFLRAFRNHPNGPGASEWPSPLTFRRWMRREGFRAAMASLRETLRLQSDLHLTTAAATAARTLHATLDAAPSDDRDALNARRAEVDRCLTVMRHAHLRQRFVPDPPPPPVRRSDERDGWDLVHPSLTVGEARNIMKRMQEARSGGSS